MHLTRANFHPVHYLPKTVESSVMSGLHRLRLLLLPILVIVVHNSVIFRLLRNLRILQNSDLA